MEAMRYRFSFPDARTCDEAKLTLSLAVLAVEGLFGTAQVQIDVSYQLDAAARSIVVDGSTAVGAALVKVFANLALREFGEQNVNVERMDRSPVAAGNAA